MFRIMLAALVVVGLCSVSSGQARVPEEREAQQKRQAEAQLERRLPEIRFDAVPLTDVIDFLRDVTGVKIVVNWKALEEVQVTPKSLTSAQMRDVPFREVLTILLDGVSGGKLDFVVQDGVVTISTTEDLEKNSEIRVYDVRDIVGEGAGSEKKAQTLMEMITGSIDPKAWAKAEPTAVIKHQAGQLLVTATRGHHKMIVNLLEKMRELRK